MALDQLTAQKLGIQISSNVSAIDEYFRQSTQIDPPLDATYKANLANVINECYVNIAKLAQFALDQNQIQAPEKITPDELQTAGIIPTPESAPEVALDGSSTTVSKSTTVSASADSSTS